MGVVQILTQNKRNGSLKAIISVETDFLGMLSQQIKKDLTLNYTSGAKFTDVTKYIKEIKGRKQKDITIVCGTNDSAIKKSVDKIIEECKYIITAAKIKTERVHISSILPRTDKRVNVI